MSKLSYRLLIFLLFIIVYFATSVPKGGYFSFLGITGFRLSILIGSIVYYILIALLLNTSRGRQNRIFILLAALISFVPELIFRVFNFSDTLISFLDAAFKILSIIISWLIFQYTKSSLIRVGGSILILGLTVWFSFYTFDYWINYVQQGSFEGKKYQHITNGIKVQNINGEYEELTSLYEHYILLDFWSRQCGVCYKMMPEVEELYCRFKNRDDVEVYSVFCRYKDDKYNTGDSIVRNRGYTFPVVSIDCDSNSVLLKEMGVERYPQFIIMDRENNIIYHGTLSLAKKFLNNLCSDNISYGEGGVRCD